MPTSPLNQLFMWNFICCTMAHNENRRGAYGMTMRVMDMAGTVDVLKEVEIKDRKSTVVVKVTEKSPGAGADTTISFVMQMLVSSLTHISQTKEVKELAYTTKDTIHKNVSKMSYALLQGSGVLVNGKGEIMGNNTSFQKELSNNAHFTELLKTTRTPQCSHGLSLSWHTVGIASSTQDKNNGFYKVSHVVASDQVQAPRGSTLDSRPTSEGRKQSPGRSGVRDCWG